MSDGPFHVMDYPPYIEILAPSDGTVVAHGQTVTFRGFAYDWDLGTVPPDLLEWHSSRDGLLGKGPSVSATGLSLGDHTITFRASDGEQVEAYTIHVTVVSTPAELPPPADRLIAGPQRIVFDPGRHRTRSQLTVDNHNQKHAITWNAQSDAPWIQLDASSGVTRSRLSVSFVNSGITEGTHRGTITITSPATPGQALAIPVEVTIAGAPLACPGDCGGDGAVSIQELLTGINIALGNLALGACGAFDTDRSETVTVDEILPAVSAALEGCRA